VWYRHPRFAIRRENRIPDIWEADSTYIPFRGGFAYVMSRSRSARHIEIDPLKIVIGVFVILGVVLTAVAAYALIETLAGGLSAVPPELGMTVIFSAALLATVFAAHRARPSCR
jgi:hypothetical protein